MTKRCNDVVPPMDAGKHQCNRQDESVSTRGMSHGADVQGIASKLIDLNRKALSGVQDQTKQNRRGVQNVVDKILSGR